MKSGGELRQFTPPAAGAPRPAASRVAVNNKVSTRFMMSKGLSMRALYAREKAFVNSA